MASYLPNDCWEYIFTLLEEEDDYNSYLQSLSTVSKQFLTITNNLHFSLSISNQTLPLLPRLLTRFPNLTSLDLTRFRGNLDALLYKISNYPLQLTSLNLSNRPTIPANGLRILSKKIKNTLTSLNCSYIDSIFKSDLVLIADSFPFLEDLDLSFPQFIDVVDFGIDSLSLALPYLRKVNLSGSYYINELSLFHLCKNCPYLEEVVMFRCTFIIREGVASAIRNEFPLLCR